VKKLIASGRGAGMFASLSANRDSQAVFYFKHISACISVSIGHQVFDGLDNS
jgi:hypothetical protein